MGIPSYFNYILKNHHNIIVKKPQVSSDNLFVDANSLIYDTINDYDGKIPDNLKTIFQDIYNNILKLVKNVNPKEKSYICLDGVPPVAKIMQQKQRRFKGTLINKILTSKTPSSFNRNQITPGSSFMNQLDDYLYKAFSSHANIVFSGSCIPMEGEHKICKIISSDENFKQKNSIVYGLDADLFMLGLLMVFKEYNIFLFKETKHFSYIKGIDEKEFYYFNINTFSHQLSQKLQVNRKQSICDYCLLAFLCGNDFLPHLHSINIRNEGIPYIIDKYLELNKDKNNKKPLVNIETGNINWRNFRDYIATIAREEKDKIFQNLSWKISQKNKIKPLSESDKLDLLPCVDNEKEIHLYNNIEEFEDFIFHDVNIKSVSKNYVEMIEWTWYYYFHNDVIDDTKYYCYSKAPLLSTCLPFIPLFNDDVILNSRKTDRIAETTLLLYVIPFHEHKQLIDIDKNNTNFWSIYNKIPQLRETNFEIDYFLCKFFWEGHLNIPHIDIFHLNNIIMDSV